MSDQSYDGSRSSSGESDDGGSPVRVKGSRDTGGQESGHNRTMDSQIASLLSAEAQAFVNMISFLKSQYNLDDETITRVRESPEKTFLMSMHRPGTGCSGICLASRAWLEWCGLGDSDVAWQQPQHVLQGPLSRSAQMVIMPDFYTGYHLSMREPQTPFQFLNVVNYRRVWDADPTFDSFGEGGTDESSRACGRVPFKFTLTIRRLKSDVTGIEYPIFESIMTDEQDLTEDEICRLQNNASSQLEKDYQYDSESNSDSRSSY